MIGSSANAERKSTRAGKMGRRIYFLILKMFKIFKLIFWPVLCGLCDLSSPTRD